ncbi:arylsulfatase [Pelagicoccus mobilis]|uniref:Arylsulfatase n=1 Tax=Pelagicoccus mobilis TaxID=415221 RepID=A0A934VJU6_9BACT|nr:arylsulfatase [Pelagicoccus mobilis]MBK1875991.1 arylsulfatase [Pelagicoccus mobilis]
MILFADDLGYSDIGCYGGEIETPNLDRLASEGLRFTQFMNCSKCAPSRVALLTGLYPIEGGCNGPPAQMVNGMTIAEVLKTAGYQTWMTGKWHAKENPVKRGFDRYYGSLKGGSNYFEPKGDFMEGDKPIKPVTAENRDTFYTTDVYTNEALKFLEEHKEGESPFLLYVSYNAPHYPLQAWPEDIAKYRRKYLKGWDAIKEERFKRQLELGIVKPGWKNSQRDPDVPAWEDFDRKDDADLTMAVYAAMVDRLDWNVGRLLAKLEEIGVSENTVVLFFSDNGACAEGAMWDGVTARNKPDTRNSQAKLGKEWANACNTPYRKFKRYMYNGGQLTPFIVRWPEGISEVNRITHEPAHIVDLAPTLYSLAGADYPEGQKWEVPHEKGLLKDWTVQPLSGTNMLPMLKGEPAEEGKYYFGHFQAGRMIMKDGWKLVSDGHDGTVQHLYDFPWELYEMDTDATESHDLAAQYPEKVAQMDRDYRAWIDRADRLTGVKSHEWYQPRFTDEQRRVADELADDREMKRLLKERKRIGLKIVEELEAMKLGMKTVLGMAKVPMSYFGIVEAGRKYASKSRSLDTLYRAWDEKVRESERFCSQKGEIYAEVWAIQERIRIRLPADEAD